MYVHKYAEKGLCNGRASVCLSARPSVCPIYRQQQWPAAGLLLNALWAGDIRQ